jgi:hypothetical protein
MEGKTLAKDDEKEELLLEKILEIEEAYFDLMKAYSSCLTILNVKATDCYFNRFWLTPKIVRHRIGQHVNFLREVFLSLIAQNREKIDSKIIKRFELYCGDINKLSVQVTESGSASIFKINPTVIFASVATGLLSIITGLIRLILDLQNILVTIGFITIVLLLVLISLYFFISCVCSARKSNRVLCKTGVEDKQKTIFGLLQEYLEFL